jgi:spore maturation protein SpmA
VILNFVWLALFFLGAAYALASWVSGADAEGFARMSAALFDSAQSAVTLILGLAGALLFWMGLLAVAERAGAVNILGRLFAPLLRRVFPGLPADHPAAGAIVMNFAANALGLDNAATPAGLKAMRELQTLNPDPETASDHQIMFMVLHSASLTLVPVSILGLRAAAGAANPADVFLPLLVASLCSVLGGFLAVAIRQKLRLLDPVLWLTFTVVLVGVAAAIHGLSGLPAEQAHTLAGQCGGALLIGLVLWILGLAAWRRIDAWSVFLGGAGEGLRTTLAIAPNLVGMLVAIGVFRASGALDELARLVWPLLSWTGLPDSASHAIPTMLAKPLTGSGARALMVDTMHAYGADSFPGRLSCLFQGSSDTTLYVLALYSGACGLKRLRYALPCALIADLSGFAGAVVMALVFFS